jgi:hypothetical protein
VFDHNWSCGRSRWYREDAVERSAFVSQLTDTARFLLNLESIRVIWGCPFEYSMWDQLYERQPSTALDVYGPALGELWRYWARSVRTLRLDVYIDALEALPAFNASLAPHLVEIDIRVYGGEWPANTSADALGAQLAFVGRTLVAPAAERLQVLSATFLPWGSTGYGYSGEATRHGQTREVPVAGFFNAFAALPFPMLHSLRIKSPFTVLSGDEQVPVGAFIDRLQPGGKLESLALSPAFPLDPYQERGREGVRAYADMLRAHGRLWSTPRHLELYVPPLYDVGPTPFLDMHRDGMALFSADGVAQPNDELSFFLDFFTPDLGTRLVDLNLTSPIKGPDMRLLLEGLQLHPASPMRGLSFVGEVVRPSLLDDLARLAPCLERLSLNVGRGTEPDVVISEDRVRSMYIERLRSHESTSHWTDEDLEEVRAVGSHDVTPGSPHSQEADDEDLVRGFRERLHQAAFVPEMRGRRYDGWALRRLSVREDVPADCTSNENLGPPNARHVAEALAAAVPGLVVESVSPRGLSLEELRKSGLTS